MLDAADRHLLAQLAVGAGLVTGGLLGGAVVLGCCVRLFCAAAGVCG